MSLLDDVSSQMKAAMKAQDKGRLSALRGIRAAFIEALKADGRDSLPDEEAVAVMRRLAKQRVDSITEYDKAGRTDLADIERAELAVIEEFLPRLADAATTRTWVADAIAASGATGPGDMGKVMAALMAAHKGELDGKLANTLVRELLR